MSVKVMTAVWENGPTDSTQRFVLLALADNASDDGGNAYPSIPGMARKCALSERTVIRAIDALVKSGYLIRRRRRDASNIYQIVLSKLVCDTLSHTVSDKMSHTVSDKVSHTKVTEDHLGGDTMSHGGVTLCHPNHPINHPVNRQGEGESAVAPPPTPAASFQPVPEAVKRQKARRGIKDPEPDAPAAPPALRLLHELTGYWPGDDNAPLILAGLGDDPDRSALARAVELWRGSGHKINNWLGICDWYHEILRDPGWTPQARFRRGGNSAAANPMQSVSKPAPGSQPVTW